MGKCRDEGGMGYEARYQGDAGDAKADDAGAIRGNSESRLVGEDDGEELF